MENELFQFVRRERADFDFSTDELQCLGGDRFEESAAGRLVR